MVMDITGVWDALIQALSNVFTFLSTTYIQLGNIQLSLLTISISVLVIDVIIIWFVPWSDDE